MNTVHGSPEPGSPEAMRGLDLNLIVALDALMREQGVTRAAERVGITQSAMSHALRRLREQLGDPLLVRGGRGMLLTPRAESLRLPIRHALSSLHRALVAPAEFDPKDANRTFRMVSPDLFDALVLPPLLARLGTLAPKVSLTVAPSPGGALFESLETGELDFAVMPRTRTAPVVPQAPAGELQRTTLFTDRMVCLLRGRHPALRARKAISLKSYLELPHVLVSPTGSGHGPVDLSLQGQQRSRHVALRVPNFTTALSIVEHSDLVLTGPDVLLKLLPKDSTVIALPTPVKVPGHHIDLVWHQRYSHDPAHLWMRELLRDTARNRMR